MTKSVVVTVPGSLPGMNEIIEQAKRHPAKYSSFKKKYTNLVHWCANGKGKFTRVNVTITWYCENRVRDKDNIMAGAKFIFDGLVNAGVLTDDRWKQIGDISHRFDVDKRNPRVEILLEEVEGERGEVACG